jgi:hypothetical protein
VSSNPEEFERFCFSRWFYIARVADLYQMDSFVCLDSDCMLFEETTSLLDSFAPGPGIYVCETGSPHCALVRGGLQRLLDYFLKTFIPEKKAYHQDHFCKSRQSKDLWMLSDMFVIKEFISSRGPGGFYGYKTRPDRAINSIMSERKDFVVWPGRKSLKRVYWMLRDGLLIPQFQWVSNGERLTMAALHYKGDSKKRMRRFNHLGLKSSIINKLRAAWLNTIPPINFLSFR